MYYQVSSGGYNQLIAFYNELCIFPFICNNSLGGVNAIVKRGSASNTTEVCNDSNGIAGFYWSHRGDFLSGDIPKRKENTVTECGDYCLKDSECLAFHFYPSQKDCQPYYNLSDLNKERYITNYDAYIKCKGRNRAHMLCRYCLQ